MDNYEDIINLPYKKSTRKKHMSLRDRAAQFGSFSALKGHDEAIEETARLTDQRPELDEYKIEEINLKILQIMNEEDKEKEYYITYFIPDEKKSGGMCLTVRGRVEKVKEFEKEIHLSDKRIIPIWEIIQIQEAEF